jgi:periplasmic protein TonB
MSIERRAVRQIPLAVSLGRQTRQRGVFRGLGLSAAVHLLVIGLAAWGTHHIAESDGDPGDGSGRNPGGGGGGAFAVLVVAPSLPSAPPPPALTVPSLAALTIPVEQAPETVPEQISAEELARLAQATGVGAGTGGGPGSGTGSGGGSGSGVGTGVGPDSGAGGGHGTYFMPQPQSVILPPPDRPASVRGITVTARFEISATGEVLRVTLEPTLPDRRFRDAFLERLRRYAFTPASAPDGHPVPSVYEVRFPL